MIETGIFNHLYEFFSNWLFAGGVPEAMTQQGAELTVIAFTVFTLISTISIVIIPIKALIRLILNA